MNDDQKLELGDVVDQLDNALALNKLGSVAYDGVISIIKSARATAKDLYVELVGDNPWFEFDNLSEEKNDAEV